MEFQCPLLLFGEYTLVLEVYSKEKIDDTNF